jgi:hypothetical protein
VVGIATVCALKIVNGTKVLFLHASSDIVTIPKELYKTHGKKQHFFCQ